MVASDHTSYPFATQNQKDFQNLMKVYLDATFFPNLEELDFSQEGHRLELANSSLEFKGVVYNEMKGAMVCFSFFAVYFSILFYHESFVNLAYFYINHKRPTPTVCSGKDNKQNYMKELSISIILAVTQRLYRVLPTTNW